MPIAHLMRKPMLAENERGVPGGGAGKGTARRTMATASASMSGWPLERERPRLVTRPAPSSEKVTVGVPSAARERAVSG